MLKHPEVGKCSISATDFSGIADLCPELNSASALTRAEESYIQGVLGHYHGSDLKWSLLFQS